MELTSTIALDFQRESHRIDQLIWDAMALRPGESALFCGFTNNLEWIKRAAGIGVAVSVISDDNAAIREFDGLPIAVLRGSTSMLPARDASFDVTVAFHYLHEIDPFFHASVVAELARVGKRCVIVEPAPPSDPLGLRIASLYSRAKRGLGQFEQYHHLDYWRKLLSIVKSDVSAKSFAFTRTPPREAIRDTVSLIIDTMAAEETPEAYLVELRALAARPDAQLVPQARYVIVGASTGATQSITPGTEFRRPEESRPASVVKPFVPPTAIAKPNAPTPLPPSSSTVYTSADMEPEFPAIDPPPAREPAAPPASQIARNAFGLTAPPEAPSTPTLPTPKAAGDPDDDLFGVAANPADAAEEFGWQWEPPEDTHP